MYYIQMNQISIKMIIYGLFFVGFFFLSSYLNELNRNFPCLLLISIHSFRIRFNLVLTFDQLTRFFAYCPFACSFIWAKFANKQWTNKHLSVYLFTTQSANFLITVVDSAVLFDLGVYFV